MDPIHVSLAARFKAGAIDAQINAADAMKKKIAVPAAVKLPLLKNKDKAELNFV
jgi:hypothetical protein